MIHKILPHGSERKGGRPPRNPFLYLFEKKRDVAAKLLRGEPAECWRVIQSLSYSQRYTSGVLSFSETLPETLQDEIIDDYERVAFAGRAEEFSRVWGRHSEHGRTELHFVIANVHLQSGKRWSHYYDPADRKLFKSWQELTNVRHALSSPDDPERVRLADLPGKLPQAKKLVFEKLDALVCAAVARGEAKDRADVVKVLQSAGFSVKPSRNYLGVTSPGVAEKSIRLRGKKYEEAFTRESLMKSSRGQSQPERDERAKKYEKDFEEALDSRATYVTRVCRPRRLRRKLVQIVVHDADIQNPPTVEINRPTPADTSINPTSIRNDYESGLGKNVSTGVSLALAGGGEAVWAAHRAAWTAQLAASVERLHAGLRRLGAYARLSRSPHDVAVPLGVSQSLCVGAKRFAHFFGGLFRRTTSGTALPWTRGGGSSTLLAAPSVERCERDGAADLSR